MARKAFKITVQLEIQAVTCPGVSLPRDGKIQLYLCVMGYRGRTQRISPVFPLLFHTKFECEKVFMGCPSLGEVERLLDKESVFMEMVQEAGPNSEIILAVFESSARDVLFPYPQDRLGSQSVALDLLMEPTKDFPSVMPPKVEVQTKTSVSVVPSNVELDAWRQRHSQPQVRVRRQAGLHPHCSCSQLLDRPPFVVRHVDPRLLSRKPGLEPGSRILQPDGQDEKPEKASGKGRRDRGFFSASPPRKSERDERRKGSGRVLMSPAATGRKLSQGGCPCCKCPSCPYHSGAQHAVGQHRSDRCSVCRLYRQYFGKDYQAHSESLSSSVSPQPLRRNVPPVRKDEEKGEERRRVEQQQEEKRRQDLEAKETEERTKETSPAQRSVKKSQKSQSDPELSLIHIPTVDDNEYDSHDDPHGNSSWMVNSNELRDSYRGTAEEKTNRQQFYENLERFYHKLYKRAKYKAACVREKS